MLLNDFWAKTEPFQSVTTHGVVSGHVCRSLMENYLSKGVVTRIADLMSMAEDELFDFMAYLVALHDVGKLEFHFQSMDLRTAERLRACGIDRDFLGKEHFRHEKTGEIAAKRLWKRQGQDEDSSFIFSAIIGAHHQKNNGAGSVSKHPFFEKLREELECVLHQQLVGASDLNLPELPEENEGVVEAVLLGILILSDWIASSALFSDAEGWIGNPDSQEEIRRRTLEFLFQSGLKPDSVIWEKEFSKVWPWIPQSGMRPIQNAVEAIEAADKRHRLVLIEAPMGEGKTEAGMYAAVQMIRKWRKDGFYVAMPTAATSNQMVLRMQSWFSACEVSDAVRLLHSMAWLEDQSQIKKQSHDDHNEIIGWLEPVRRGLLGQFAVGTIDQVLLSVTKARYAVLRLLGMSNKVLVIDEIHSYDVYMGKFLDLLLKWCRAMDVPVVMLSATLPPKLKAKLLKPYTSQVLSSGYPLITTVDENGVVEEHRVDRTERRLTVGVELLPILNSPEIIAQKAISLTENGGCICILMNTVKQAQTVFSVLEQFFDGDLMLFHAQYPAARRKEIEEECIRKFGKDKQHRPEKAILVATQVVEQSLDVDFDAMLTAVAPVDLLLQRMGRVFRHNDTVRPVYFQKPMLWIMIPDGENFGADAYVYPEVLLRQSIHVLSSCEVVRIPEDLAQLISDGYDETKVPMSETEKWMEHLIGEQVTAGQSQKYLIGDPDKQYAPLGLTDQLFDDDGGSRYLAVQTRLGEPTVRIALLEPDLYCRVEAYADANRVASIRDKGLARSVQECSVSVAEHRLRFDKSDLSYIKGDMLLAGVRIYPAQNGCCELQGGRLIYDTKLGVIIEEGEK